jgi:hypothetical protein
LPGGDEAGAAGIAELFAARLAALRRRLSPRDMPAAARALREEKAVAMRALRVRRKAGRRAARIEIKKHERSSGWPEPK